MPIGQSACTVVALETPAVKTVLIIDDHLGFLFWLGKILENAGYSVVPAVSIARAESILRLLALIPDLLIISLTLPDSSKFIRSLRRDWPSLRVIAAVDKEIQEAHRLSVEADWWGRKPAGSIIAKGAILDQNNYDEMQNSLNVSRAEWLLIVRMALERNTTSAD